MKILEVRDGFIKFEADNSIYLSSFVQIEGMEKSYIAQVIQIKRAGGSPIAYAKILFLYDGTLQSYDKTLPSKESEIKEFTYDILNNSIDAPNPVIAGKTLGDDINIVIDSSAFDKKMLISVDDKNDNNIIIKNITKQFSHLKQNVIILDTLGIVNAQKYTAGIDFKLPLDTASLAFMYEDCLNDATAESKSLIIEIFKELAEYSRTVPFVPFDALKQIVFDMVDNSHIFKLLVLKNKLIKFDRLGYFAKNNNEVETLNHILNQKIAVIDLSKLDTSFQNRYLDFIYEKLKDRSNTQILLELSNTVNKKNLKNILTADEISTTFITHSKFKYLNDIKNLFDNFIITPSITNNTIFNVYSTFLNAMQKNSYLIAGEATNYIPLVSRLELINDTLEINDSVLEEISEQAPALDAEELQEDDAEQEEAVLEESFEAVDTEPVEQEVTDIEEVPSEEPLSSEEILSNIEEKSADIITSAAEDLTPPENMTMFGEDDDDASLTEPDIIDEIPDEISSSLPVQEEAPEEVNEENDILDESDLDDSKQEDIQAEEIPLLDSFETEIHPNEEISDYIPQEENPPHEEISLEEALDDSQNIEDFSSDTIPEEELSAYENLDTEDGEDNVTAIELGDDIDLDLEPEQEEIQELPQESAQEEEDINIMPIENSNFDEFDEIVELNPDEADENDIVIDMDDSYEELSPDDIDAQIVKDVDKVFTTRKDETDISDSDLDFIDELNNDSEDMLEEISDSDSEGFEELALPEEDENDGILEEVQEPAELQEEAPSEDGILETKNSSTPIVPVYDADIPQEDLVISDPIQQGDTVTHVKYGTGVVEKMIKYGNKTLFSINFDNIGRRLLDPTLTEIKKS